MSASKTTWGAVFDWDGVIIDSSALHEESWHLCAKELNLPIDPSFFKKSFGMKNEKIIPEILKWTTDPKLIEKYSLRKEVLYRELLAKKGLSPLPGVVNFLKSLKEQNIPRVVASSSHRLNIEQALDLLHLKEYFSEIVSAEDVTHGKPHPEVFQKAAGKIKVSPAQCVVFEDAMVGIQAAKAAGMRAVALTTTHTGENFKNADMVVENLSFVSVSQLEKKFF